MGETVEGDGEEGSAASYALYLGMTPLAKKI
jgi:hypothetical protein